MEQEVADFETQYGPGDYVDTKGKVLGRHKGYAHYTIGQRKGLGIALGQPMYVVRLDVERNQVVLGTKEDLMTQQCYATQINWMKIDHFTDGLEVMAKVRYKSTPGKASLYNDPEGVRVVFHEPIESITPGQSIVMYQGDDVLCAGVLK